MSQIIIRRFAFLFFLFFLVTGALFLSVITGPVAISVRDLINPDQKTFTIIYSIRLPRIVLALSAGASLSLAGVILQALFRNPLVEPYTLGLSGGASLGVALNLLAGLNQTIGSLSFPLTGFGGAFMVILFLYAVSLKRGMMRLQGLLLTGVMISFISSSLIMLIMALSRIEDLQGIIYWMMGSLDETVWPLIGISVFISLSSLLYLIFNSLSLNALMLGDEEAYHLGINVDALKKRLFFLACMLTGITVSITGIIGFVGLVVPHIVRSLSGPDHRFLIPGSFLAGGCFLLLADTVARTIISPVELPVGVVTGITGGGLFIYILLKKSG
jgi:iron complex transport system permease protein